MKPVSLIVAVVMSLLGYLPPARGELRIGYGVAGQLAMASDIPGKNVPGQCFQFARALHARFQAAGIRSRIITYGYEPNPVPVSGIAIDSPGRPLSHAVVAYDDGGRTYIMDNQSWGPVWVRECGAVGMMQRFSGINVAVRGAGVVSDGAIPMMVASDTRRAPRLKHAHGPSLARLSYLTAR